MGGMISATNQSVVSVPPAKKARTTAPDGFRPDVQGLRALAVSMVLVYHLYPSLVPGGFAGVDVFFVISGFLITGHLLREYRKTGTISLAGFWGRRAKRLIPASALVLAITWLVSLRVLVGPDLGNAADQVRASALYFQNWQLAGDAVDYLKSTDTASPVQHFWSLSVEEQFYLLWPLLFIAAALLVRVLPARLRAVSGYRAIVALTTAIVLGSLAYSAYYTHANPAAAYFVTTTRIWELGAGGLLALLPARLAEPVGRHGWLGWLGLAMAVASAFVLRGTMPFPGVIALLPVGGAVLLIACGSPTAHGGPARLMSLKPLVFLGGISYSLYLWHWPLISLSTYYRGRPVGTVTGPVIILASVLLAWLTKVFIEDRVRQARFLSGHPWRSVSTALAAVLPVALVTGYLVTQVPWNGQLGPGHPGAAALAAGAPDVPAKPILPPPGNPTTSMRPVYWQKGCLDNVPNTTIDTCVYGDTVHPRLTVALVGDSVAGNWFPALNELAVQQHWELVTEMHGECLWTATLLWYGPTSSPYTACQQWGTNLLHALLTTIRPNVVIVSGRQEEGTVSDKKAGAVARRDIGNGMVPYWKQLLGHGIPVIAIKETPEVSARTTVCILKHRLNYQPCATPTSQAIVSTSPIQWATGQFHGAVPVIDMNSLICSPSECEPVVGNVFVYFDSHHITASYGQTLTPYLARRLVPLVNADTTRKQSG
jgi:peptidoglycan/LPS O-acetylase OafA/YrhL